MFRYILWCLIYLFLLLGLLILENLGQLMECIYAYILYVFMHFPVILLYCLYSSIIIIPAQSDFILFHCHIWVFSLNATNSEMHYFTTKITIYNINFLSITESRDAPVEFSFMLLCLCTKWIYWILLKINVSKLNQCSQRRQCMC